MAQKYLERLTVLMQSATPLMSKKDALEIKHFFSGAALYVNARICLTLTPTGLALKLPEKYRSELLRKKGAKPLRYFPKSPIKKEYVVLPRSMIDDITVLRHWIKMCLQYSRTLPKPGE